MNEIFSFYERSNGRERKELLIGSKQGHIEQMLELVRSSHNSSYELYAKKLVSNIEPLSLLTFAVIFHDVGKVFYQEDVRNCKHLSFGGHEFLSAFVFNELKRKVIEKDPANFLFSNFGRTIEFAIFYHHHAMNTEQRKELLKEVTVAKLRSNIELLKQFFEEIYKFQEIKQSIDETTLSETVDAISKKIPNSIAELKREIEEQIEKPIWKELQSETTKLKLSYLLLSGLIVIDDMVARKTRGEERNDAFSEAIEDFFNLYIRPRNQKSFNV